ncbi:aromatic ring-hydroxylating oxygenase subunit alpha [Castellaniella caeni]|uniref:aromatic ring-hydroxylating oxygenase subunit alpha n=1 Tax=Castellaniella caeni TaxID=266123 RepID=UPI00082DFBFA|nr:aromatic ring-hydroxylating dioxygenase subunit alpha [Castellaniella caeni]
MNHPSTLFTADLASQLPVHQYFDDAVLAEERRRIFAHSTRYVGHEHMVPQPGDWRTLTHENGGRVLLRDRHDIRLLSNVCRHRQALMLGSQNGRDTACAAGNLCQTGGRILCPVHHWSYSPQGQLLDAPLFPEKPELALQEFPLQHLHGLLFEGARDVRQDLGALFERPEFDFSNYQLDHVEVHPCHYNWKTFIEIYLEDYHVGPFHPGLGQFVTCDDLSWEFGDFHSMQRVGVNQALGQPGTDVYRQWHDRLLQYRSGTAPDFGAIWVTYFPTHMIELYPHVLVLSTLHPVSPQETVNVIEFYYPEEIVAFERDFIEAHRAAYLETAIEDDEIGERMDAGRRALLARGTSECGPYQSPLEDGMAHFHAWYRRMMGSEA